MSKENQIAFEKFDDYLRLAQQEGHDNADVDFRAWVIENRYAQWNVGQTRDTLTKKYGANLRALFPNASCLDDVTFGNGSNYMFLGTVYQDPQLSHKGGVRALQSFQAGNKLVLYEQGFLASSHSWSESFKSGKPNMACLGYVYDDIAHYFMADYPNRLIHRMNSEIELSAEDFSRASAAMARIVERKISKYNSQPIVKPMMSGGYKSRVLVCDQAFADASTIYGKVTERDFEKMLLAAISENPTSQILIKTHPDTHWEKGKRVGYFNHLQDVGRIRILRDPVNPFSLFECVDKVYVGTSQMGLEALFAGKEVICFGAPFYSGWGLTDDRKTIPHRHRKRGLEEVFYFFYIWYTIYNVPGCATPSRVEDAIDFIYRNRPVKMPREHADTPPNPKVSVILPVYGVEKYINQCLYSIRGQTLEDIEIITVNDCSPDGSQAIIDRHAADDPRIRAIVLKENVGQGFARNTGIEIARGEFIQFLDSDDILASKSHLEDAYKTACHDGADMVRGRKIFERLENAQGEKIGMRRDWCEEAFKVPFHGKTFAEQTEVIQGRHFWNWLYRRQFLIEQDIRFLTPQWEEKPFLLKALLRAKSLSSIDSEGFVYRVREDSTARRKKTLKDVEYQVANFESLVDLLHDGGALDRKSKLFDVSRYLVTQFLNLMVTGFAIDTVRRETAAVGEKELFERLQRLLVRTGMKATDISPEPKQLRETLKANNAYPLVFAAILSGRFEFVQPTLDLSKIPQSDYIAEMLRVPQDAAERQFQEALSLYARNDLVTTDKDAVVLSQDIAQKPRLIIHIGSTKTGSTFIQHFLEQNRAALLRAGVYVPEVGLFWQQARPHKQAGHAQFVPESVQQKSQLKDHVDATIAHMGGKIHTVILSSEAYFLNPNAIELARHFSDYDIEMVTYLRRQDDWANSQYAEFVAGGAVGRVSQSIEDWLKTDQTRKRLNYYGRMKLWETVIDKSKIHIGIYDRKRLKGGDIVSDFLAMTRLASHADLPRPETRQENRFPFGTAHVNFIRRLNGHAWSDRNAYFNFIEAAGQKVTQSRQKKNLPTPHLNLLTDTMRAAILDDVAQTNAALATEFLGREDGVLFESFVPNNNEIVDVISNDELEAIMQAYDVWAPKTPKRASAPAAKAKGRSAPSRAAGAQNSANVFPTNRTLVARAFGLAGRRMGVRKLAKLDNNPDMFFADMQGRGGMLVRTALKFERRLRS